MKLPFAKAHLAAFARRGPLPRYSPGTSLRATLDRAVSYPMGFFGRALTPPLRFHYGTALGWSSSPASDRLSLAFFSAFKEIK